MKKIMFFLHGLTGGGAERTVINIMNNLNKDEYDIILVLGSAEKNDYSHIINDNIKIQFLKVKRMRYWVFDLRKVILQEKPDLLFSTINENNLILLIAKVLSFRKIPVIVREANNRTESGKVTKLNRLMTRILYNHFANEIISLSNGVKEDLVNNFGVYENRIKVIYNPVEIDKIKKLASKDVSNLIIDHNYKTIIAVGRLVDQKNYPLLLNSFKKVRNEIDSKLVILGQGKLEEELKQLAEEINIIEDVKFIGFQKNPYKYLNKADLFVLSSNWEGFGHVIVEAMASGTPVISTDCNSGPREILEDNKYGVLIPPNDVNIMSKKIAEVLKDNELRTDLVKRGYERADTFDAKKIVREYEELFNKHLI